MHPTLRTIINITTAFLLLAGGISGISGAAAERPQTTAQKKKQTTRKNNSGKTGTAKKAPAQKTSSKKKKGGNTSVSKTGKKESVSDIKRRQAEAQKEIQLTREQIAENERAVKRGLNELGKLQTDIAEGKKKLDDYTAQVKGLDTKISTISGEISKEEAELAKLRTEYLKAVKAMRVKRKSNSDLAFVFSSSSFSEAMRRMRYLKQFSQWREKRNADINGKVESLKGQKSLLDKTREQKDLALRKEAEAHGRLQKQYSEQDAVVVKLKANGQALKTHLANKQSEANRLKGQVAALIAEEQRKAEAEQRAREEAERKERLRREELARREAAEAEEKAKKEELADASSEVREETASKSETSGKNAGKTATKKEKEKKNKEAAKNKESKPSSGEYAQARKRRPRGKADDPSATAGASAEAGSTAKKTAAAAAGNFASMRGSLPRPVAGAFKITSRFGRHALPDLPDVMYDNPGIDAEVAAGATAQAVYGGKVSGVYVLPGFSTVVIVNHGSYYTVYGNIQTPSVKVGDVVKQGQGLGRLAPDEDDPGHSSIHFEVWRNREKLNPTDWIR